MVEDESLDVKDIHRDISQVLTDGDQRAVSATIPQLLKLPADTQQTLLRKLETVAQVEPAVLEPAVPTLEAVLSGGDRSVRLTAVKVLATIAATQPNAVADLSSTLTDALSDDFYYVRGRAAQALGHVAETAPEAVDTTTIIARLLNALSLDRTETRHYVSEALCRISFGDPAPLRTMTSDIAEHLSDEEDLVRYYLTTTLAVVATAEPIYVAAVEPELRDRLDDDVPFVRGRAAETLGLIARADPDAVEEATESLLACREDGQFVATRATFALHQLDESPPEFDEEIGTYETIVTETPSIVEEITSPDSDETSCPQCGQTFGEAHPPMCPGCGRPLI
ncbi:HEAT repeat domain-containing protein [Halorientalis brevis]|uniref:HEAT repeat domain-containing protein n=1 Tax=Halorientalis brevis TaxID=1126241 RepID=A0ABD6CGV0_9EURY|nr:hypothetical protein [Halorientalis brevis]